MTEMIDDREVSTKWPICHLFRGLTESIPARRYLEKNIGQDATCFS